MAMPHDTGPGHHIRAPDARARYTATDLLGMPERDVRYELVAGELRVTTPASGAHGLVVGRVFLALGRHVHDRSLGALFTEATGFQLRQDPDTVRCPDVAFVRAERLPEDGLGPGFMQLAPDLAVEVTSPDDRPTESGEKVKEYLEVGVRAVWVVDPSSRTVTVHQAGRVPRLLHERDALDGGEVVPGFHLEVRELFVGVRAR